MAIRVLLLFSALLAFHAAQGKLDVLNDPSTIAAKPGDKVQLKCLIKNVPLPLNLDSLMVQWFTRGKQIAEFDRKITYDKPGMSMSLEDLKKGEVMLNIDSFTAEHAGNYRCYIYHGLETSMKQIVLTDASKPAEDETLDGKVELSSCETVLDRKLDKVISWFDKVDAKLDGLSKCCGVQQKTKGSN